MKIHDKKMSATSFPLNVKMILSTVASCSLLVCGIGAADASTIGGDSTSILRIRETTNDRNLVPVYEYLHLNASDTDKAGDISVHVGVWGRIDWVDKTTDKSNDGDVQYGFISFRGAKNNLQAQAGRQFINEGVVRDHVDGLYLRSDLAYRFTAAGFVGSPATTDPNREGGALIFGGRVAHSVPSLYSIGFSMVKNNSGGDHLREEEGIDLWLHPIKMVDVAGRSSYNSLTGGWNEHDYMATITPFDPLRLSFTLTDIKYRNYFHHATTSALSLANGVHGGDLDPREEEFALGGNVGFTVNKNLNVSAEYKHYSYDVQGDAEYFGGGVTFFLPASATGGTFYTPGATSAGVSYHRMNGDQQRLRYDQFRIWATQKIGKADITLDFFDVAYDSGIQRTSNTYSFAAAAGYDVTRNLRVAADLDYMKSVDMNHDLRGLFKVVYAFGSERRSK